MSFHSEAHQEQSDGGEDDAKQVQGSVVPLTRSSPTAEKMIRSRLRVCHVASLVMNLELKVSW